MRWKSLPRTAVKYALSLFLVICISFFLPRLLPGSPLFTLAGEGSGYADGVPAAALAQFEAYYAPELPLHQQFLRYLGHLARLDLGISFFYKTPVLQRILSAARWTLRISVSALALSAVLGTLLGVAMGMAKKGRGAVALPPLLAIQAIPTFLLAALAQLLFAYQLRWFPATGAVTPGTLAGQPGYWPDMLAHMALPLLVLVLSETPSLAIFAYNSTLRVKREPYVAFAGYLAISPRRIRWHFILKNVLPDLIGKLNIQAIFCIMGSMFVEAVFSYPGLGHLLKHATSYRDYPLMQGILLITCLYGIGINLLFELFLSRHTRTS